MVTKGHIVNEITVEEKRARLQKYVSIGALGVVGLAVSPVIFLAIGGLVGLAVAAGIGFTLVTFAPVFALKISNAKYRAIDAEKVSHIKKVVNAASENPIETMTNLLQAKREAFKVFEQNVVNAATARDTFKNKVDKFSKRYPERAVEFQNQLSRMVDLVNRKTAALKDAQKSLNDGAMKLEEMQAYWEMSKDAMELNKAAGMDTGDQFEKLKADTAVDAVLESMNRSFAELEVASALAMEPDDKTQQPAVQLTHTSPVTLDIQDVTVKQTVGK